MVAVGAGVGDHLDVERVSGKGFPEFTKERIFAPLGMTHTSWRDDFNRIVKNRAIAYAPAGPNGGFKQSMPFMNVVGNGGMLTTIGDFLIWNEALTQDKLGLSKALVETLTKYPPTQMIYVSCNPATLARDLAALKKRLFINSITPLDMFPQTAEVEVVAELSPN